MKFMRAVSIVLLSSSLVVGCGDDNAPKNKSTSEPSGPESIVRLSDQYSAELVKPNRRYKIGVLYPFSGIPFWTNDSYGIMDQAEKVGVDIVWLSSDGYQNVDKQIQQIEDMVAQRVDAIILGATSFSGTARAVENAVAKGIPVINQVTSTNSPKVSVRVMTDYDNIGKLQADALGQLLAGKGKILMLSGPAGAEWAQTSVKAFKSRLAEKYPGIVVAAERNSNPDRTEALKHTEDALVAFPDLVGVFSVTDSLALGAADAVVRAGRIDNVQITTAGFSQDALGAMKAGHVDVNVDESPLITGRVALNSAVKALNGEKLPHTIFVPNPVFTADKLAEVKPDNHWAPAGWRLK